MVSAGTAGVETGRRRSWRIAGALSVLLVPLVAGCSSLQGDTCAVGHSEQIDRPGSGRCSGSWFDVLNQRSVIFTGEDSPRLYNNAPPRQGPVIDTSRVNAPPGGANRAPVVGYSGQLRYEIAGDASTEQKDLGDLRSVGARIENPEDRVTVNFNNATYDFFLRQMLGGALGVNYVAPPGLGGTVTFRTEQPVPKAQVLQIVRDVLARDGLVMRLSNGVFHIGRPEQMAQFDNAVAASRPGDVVTRPIRLKKGSAFEYIQFLRQLLPEYMQIEAAAPDTIMLRGPSGEVEKTEQLIASLTARGIGEDRVAIIPLRQSAPEQVAAKLTEFYRARATNPAEAVSIIPLENQQALLVGARDTRIMEGVRRLAGELDRNLSDEVGLRIITLEYLQAEPTAQQLIAILGSGQGQGGGARAAAAGQGRDASGGGGGAGNGGGQGQGGSTSPLIRPRIPGPGTVSDDDGSGGGMAAPGFAMQGGLGRGRGDAGDNGGGGPLGGPGRGQAGGAAIPGETVVVAGGGEGIRIAGDSRNNTIMVYSTYSMFKRVREVVRTLDVAQAQVVIESTVLEVQINDRLQYGVQWFLSSSGFTLRASKDPRPADTGGSGANIIASTAVGDFQVGSVLKALQDVTNVKVLSSPYLTVVDGSSARLQIGDQIPFATATQSSNNLGQVTVTQQIEVKDTGIILEVTPRVRPNNGVLLSINQSVSKPQETVLTGNITPVISSRSMKSDIVVQSGHTALLGGLIQERHDKTEGGIPVLKNIPMFGELFKQTSDTVNRVEMLVMITPRVVRRTSEIDNITRMLHNGLYPNYMPR